MDLLDDMEPTKEKLNSTHLNMREKMDAMQHKFERFFNYLQSHAAELSHFTEPPPPEAGALVPVSRINRPVPAKRRGKSSR